MKAFRLRILSADRPFYEGDCVSLIVPTEEGQYGVMANHRNMISAIIPGALTMRKPDGESVTAAVSNGLLKIQNGEVLVLVETAELPEEIDENRARRAAENAREQLLQKLSAQEYRIAQDKIARGMSRIKIKGGKLQ